MFADFFCASLQDCSGILVARFASKKFSLESSDDVTDSFIKILFKDFHALIKMLCFQ